MSNFSFLKSFTANEWALMKTMVMREILNEQLETTEASFIAIDMEQIDGKVSYSEVVNIIEEFGYFKQDGDESTPTPEGSTPGENDKITKEELEEYFTKIDYNQNGTLDKSEFMLIT